VLLRLCGSRLSVQRDHIPRQLAADEPQAVQPPVPPPPPQSQPHDSADAVFDVRKQGDRQAVELEMESKHVNEPEGALKSFVMPPLPRVNSNVVAGDSSDSEGLWEVKKSNVPTKLTRQPIITDATLSVQDSVMTKM